MLRQKQALSVRGAPAVRIMCEDHQVKSIYVGVSSIIGHRNSFIRDYILYIAF